MSPRRKRLKFWKWMRRKRHVLPVEWFITGSGAYYHGYKIPSAKGWKRLPDRFAFEFVGYGKDEGHE